MFEAIIRCELDGIYASIGAWYVWDGIIKFGFKLMVVRLRLDAAVGCHNLSCLNNRSCKSVGSQNPIPVNLPFNNVNDSSFRNSRFDCCSSGWYINEREAFNFLIVMVIFFVCTLA
jgi:hypothetical protein